MALFVPILFAECLFQNEDFFPYLIIPTCVAIFVLLIPAMDLITKVIWVFKPEAGITPVGEDQLRKEIMSINSYNVPIMAQEKGKKIVLTWKYVDAKWWEILSKRGLTSVYKMIIKINDKKKTATLIDVYNSVSWGAGPTGVKIHMNFFRGIAMQYEIGKAWGIKENFSLGKLYDYKFDSSEIKDPVMNTILKRGWKVRLGMY